MIEQETQETQERQECQGGTGARGQRCRTSRITAVPPYRRTAVPPIVALTALLGAASLVPNPAFSQASHRTLTIGRLHYDGGGDWYANPSSLPKLLEEVGRRTSLRVTDREQVVTITSPELWDIPYIYMTGHGNVLFSDEEVLILRRYLENGGFLHADDNYGMDESFRREIGRVFRDHPLVEVPLDHPIYCVVYEMPQGIPKIHEHDGEPAQGFGIFVDDRLAVFYSYQTDLGDGWEDVGVHDDPTDIRELAFQMGVNLYVFSVVAGR